ncbi:MAG: Lpg1974 family pore-forming outer membrane protein [Simkaniaceae bacterium]
MRSSHCYEKIIFLFLMIATALHAEEDYALTEDTNPICCDTTLQCPPTVCGYNAPALYNPNACANLYVTGSFLYWKASGDYLTSAFLDTSFSPDPNSILNQIFIGETLNPNFKYKPGFKVGLGYKFKRDHWDLYAEYTRFHQTTHDFKQVDLNSQHLHATWLTFINPLLLQEEFKSVDSSWITHLDILDVEIGRNFFCGQQLILRPSFGLRTFWLKQEYNLKYVSITTETPLDSFNRSSSWGIGPRLGVNSTWRLYWGFEVVGNFGASLLHVEDHVAVKQINPSLEVFDVPGNISYSNKMTTELIKPMFDLSLGLGWGHLVFKDKCFFKLLVTYDYSLYYDQGSIRLGHAPLVAPGAPIQVVVGNAADSTGTLSLEGLTIKAGLDF